jgi:hypothetical protein
MATERSPTTGYVGGARAGSGPASVDMAQDWIVAGKARSTMRVREPAGQAIVGAIDGGDEGPYLTQRLRLLPMPGVTAMSPVRKISAVQPQSHRHQPGVLGAYSGSVPNDHGGVA